MDILFLGKKYFVQTGPLRTGVRKFKMQRENTVICPRGFLIAILMGEILLKEQDSVKT